jgi:pimeloyl-ACP methyl ester carboxylesterase
MAALSAVKAENQLLTGLDVEVRRAGKGPALLVLHSEFGLPGWLDAYERLSQSFDVIVPSLPGFGESQRPEWIMSIRDYAGWVTWFARDLGLSSPVHVMGHSLGGWIAAEIATIAPQFIDKLVLSGAMGMKPEVGEIFDYFLESGRTGIERAFHSPDQSAEYQNYYAGEWGPDQNEATEDHREMTCRVAWKPYMHSLTLPGLLPAITTPTLIVWGRQDAITPLNCGELYQRGIAGAHLSVIEGCGHMVEMEAPGAFAKLVEEFLK